MKSGLDDAGRPTLGSDDTRGWDLGISFGHEGTAICRGTGREKSA